MPWFYMRQAQMKAYLVEEDERVARNLQAHYDDERQQQRRESLRCAPGSGCSPVAASGTLSWRHSEQFRCFRFARLEGKALFERALEG